MSAIEGLGNFLSNAATGGLFGLVGSLGSKYLEGKQALEQAQIQRDTQVALSRHELELTKVQLASQQSLAQIQSDTSIAIEDAHLQEASYGNDAATYSAEFSKGMTGVWANVAGICLVLVDAIRGLIRPFVTTLLVLFNVWIAWWLWDVKGQTFDEKDAAQMMLQLVNNLALCTSLAISWYFGARSHTGKSE